MKRTYTLIAFLLFQTVSFGQATQFQGTNNVILVNPGGLRVDSVLYIPERSDSSWFGQQGNLRINAITKKLEYQDSTQWVTVAAGSGQTNYKQQEYAGAPNYTLTNTPLGNTISVSINGVEAPVSWLTIAGNVVSISVLAPFNFSIDSTDRIKIKYFY